MQIPAFCTEIKFWVLNDIHWKHLKRMPLNGECILFVWEHGNTYIPSHTSEIIHQTLMGWVFLVCLQQARPANIKWREDWKYEYWSQNTRKGMSMHPMHVCFQTQSFSTKGIVTSGELIISNSFCLHSYSFLGFYKALQCSVICVNVFFCHFDLDISYLSPVEWPSDDVLWKDFGLQHRKHFCSSLWRRQQKDKK